MSFEPLKSTTMQKPQPKFKKGDLVSSKGGADFRPVQQILSMWWDTTGWWEYVLGDKNGKQTEKGSSAEHSLIPRTNAIDAKLFAAKDTKKRMEIVQNAKARQNALLTQQAPPTNLKT